MSGETLKGWWLAMDTSTASMAIALFHDGRLVRESLSVSERNHSIRLVPAIRELAASCGIKVGELDGVAVGHGPGSYTGIRIAVTVAKMFAWSLDLPLIAVSSLEALAYGAACAAEGDVWVVPLMDARRGKAYTGLYRRSGGAWRCETEDGVRDMEEWAEELKELAGGGAESGRRIIFAGDVRNFTPIIERLRGEWRGEVSADEQPLSAAHVGELACMYGMARAVGDVHRFGPNYTQLSEPEKKWLARNRSN